MSTVTLPRADVALRCGATYAVAAAPYAVKVLDLDGRLLDELKPGEMATFVPNSRRFLWWDLPAVWRRS